MSETSEKSTVLLIAHSKRRSTLINRLLGDHYQVLAAIDPEAGWEQLLKTALISVVICDQSLAIDDFALIERIRSASDKTLAAKPILLLVGENDSEDDRELALSQGATDFINMPFSGVELNTRVRLHSQLFIRNTGDRITDLTQQSAADPLQQLAQESYFHSRIRQEFSFSVRYKSYVSVAQLRVDHLPTIVADYDDVTVLSVVESVARVIQHTLRGEDSLCYLGDGEFGILFPATSAIGAATGVKRIKREVSARPVSIADKQLPITLSGAIYSCLASESTSVEFVMNVLQERLEEAVAKGGDFVVSSGQAEEKSSISVDKALQMIERDETDQLQAQDLMLKIIPLLEYADRVLKLGMAKVNVVLQQKLSRKIKIKTTVSK